MIRFFVGFMIVFGAVGGLDTDSATLLEGIGAAIVGLSLMVWGLPAVKAQVDQ